MRTDVSRLPLRHIPTQLIGGPLGAGKTSLLRALLEQRPKHERWAILVNEFGQVGIDAALLEGAGQSQVDLSEIPGGCLCCVNGVPFQVGLGRLLRRARPDRLFIETSGLGHPAPLMRQLAQPPWNDVLQLHPLLMVLDAAALAAGDRLPDTQKDALDLAGALVMNKSEAVSLNERERLAELLPVSTLLWCSHGRVSLEALPKHQSASRGGHVFEDELPDGPEPMPVLWLPGQDWQRQHQQSSSGFSIGWLARESVRFGQAMFQRWLQQVDWLRVKAVIHTDRGWASINVLRGGEIVWEPVAPRSDNRIELILPAAVDVELLDSGLRGATLGS